VQGDAFVEIYMIRGFLFSLLFALSLVQATHTVPLPIEKPVPSSIAHEIPAGSHFSLNWAGYVARRGTFEGVGATWRVPTVTPDSLPYSADATWVGIGGTSSEDLIQAGTQAIVHGSKVEYQAWVERLPDYLEPISLSVHPGDWVSVDLREIEEGLWKLQFRNLTTGKVFTDIYEYDSSNSSAEWIEEMPMHASGELIPLSQFGSVTFHNAYAIENGQVLTPETLNAQPVTLIDEDGNMLAVPGPLQSDTFTVKR